MIIPTILAFFTLGYLMIAFESIVKINKAAIALIMCSVLWTFYIINATELVPTLWAEEFRLFLEGHSFLSTHPLSYQVSNFVVNFQIVEQLGLTAEVLLFLIGAMTIVDIIDKHGGFDIITSRITTRNIHKLLWFIAFIAFWMSALLDNMTTTIIIIMLLRRLVEDTRIRWTIASIVIISANSGGAWSPIGDITTIMLWVDGSVTSLPLMKSLLLPCIVSTAIPTALSMFMIKGVIPNNTNSAHITTKPSCITQRESTTILIIGVTSLALVPLFKELTQLPPFFGVILALGVMWVYTEILYNRKKSVEEASKYRITKALHNIDIATILFFLGVLMSVSVLECSGILRQFSNFLDQEVGNVFIIDGMIGLLSSIIDNVPLVAGAIGMYPITEPSILATVANPEHLKLFTVDGTFWHLLAYCSGTGGSILIIGSAAGVVAMGLEKISFVWYFKNITLLALIGYISGMGVYYLQHLFG